MTAVLPPSPENLERTARRLLAGGLVAIPTETVYGLAANAADGTAVARVFAAKERPSFDPLIVHTRPVDRDAIETLGDRGIVDASSVPAADRECVERLARSFWPGPLTVVLPRGTGVADLAASGLPTVAVRVPRHPVALALLARVGFPLAAPSANRFGRISPTRAEDVRAELGDRVDLILDGGRCEVGVESTIVAVDRGRLRLLRPGGVSPAEIERAAGTGVEIVPPDASAGSAPPSAPGQLASHYAPRTPLRLLRLPVTDVAALPARVGLLAIAGNAETARRGFAQATSREVIVRVLSARGDDAEAARNLFAALRELDDSGAGVLFAETVTQSGGLWPAIADRLRRAAGGSP